MSKPYESWSEIEQGIDDTYSEKDFLAVIDRDRFNATLNALAALRIELDETRRERDEARAQAVDLAKQLEAERHLHDALGSTLRIRSLESERDSLRERLGDAERVIETTSLNLCVVADSHHEDARSACRAEIEKALAEFDAKRGKR